MNNDTPPPAAPDPTGPEPDSGPKRGEFLLYQTEDGQTRVECRFAAESLWISQAGMAELFHTSKQNIAKHLKAILAEGELAENTVVNSWLTTAADGKHYRVNYYHLNAILAVGYRMRSQRGTQFRRWATDRLSEYLVKGFALDDQRLKNAGSGIYFEQLLERIRDIRSSEKVFWRKVLDIYATSIDYDPAAAASLQFFATIQNKMHWAAHGHTAAEVIVLRADARQHNMGLTSFSGATPRSADAAIAKNYLNAEELETLNRIVMAYLEFAELQAKSRRPMTMADWITKLDDFLRLSDHDVLTHAGKITAEEARIKAQGEYEAYRRQLDSLPSGVERDMARALQDAANKLQRPKKKGKKK
ncbi:MAG: virulence RhuM family protein [Phycisphaerales bacterium]|nr:virulence RhuM family protein [Phycisphaerales bacterium]